MSGPFPLSTLVTRGHMSEVHGGHMSRRGELYGDVRDNQEQQEVFPRPRGHKTGRPSKLQIADHQQEVVVVGTTQQSVDGN